MGQKCSYKQYSKKFKEGAVALIRARVIFLPILQ
ncbi:Uncharacterised protein [Zhongshania aliphaticivorans]|nr:Uncharacterised protein [Zhongshania aliphaticivorans]